MAKIAMTIVYKLRATPHPVQSGQKEFVVLYFLAVDKPDLNCTVIRKYKNLSRIARLKYYIPQYIIVDVTKPYGKSRQISCDSVFK